jgi:hypothetical protein
MGIKFCSPIQRYFFTLWLTKIIIELRNDRYSRYIYWMDGWGSISERSNIFLFMTLGSIHTPI